jgi:phosphonoacetaldehyde hydrolase
MQSPTIRLVVFDWAGTIVDHGSIAPIAALRTAFAAVGIQLSEEEARGPMGLPKRDHVRELFRLPSIIGAWNRAHGREPTQTDEDTIYERFLPLQADEVRRRSQAIPGVSDCTARLKELGVAIGTTTGYPRPIGRLLVDAASEQGLKLDHCVFPDDVPAGRPAPWMIFRIMEQSGVYPAACVVKVGDTVPDVDEARSAGVWCVGVTETGSEVGLSLEEWRALPEGERTQRSKAAGEKLLAAGAHAVIRSSAVLLPAIEELNARLRRGERP